MTWSETPKAGFHFSRPTCYIWASSQQNLSLGFLTKGDSNQPSQTCLKIEISPVLSLDMILSNKRITKALIRLSGCVGWSAPLLFPSPRRQVFYGQGPYICVQPQKICKIWNLYCLVDIFELVSVCIYVCLLQCPQYIMRICNPHSCVYGG